MHLKIFYPGGVSYGVIDDNATNKELYDILFDAATLEQGNGRKKKEVTNNGDKSVSE